MTPSPYPLQAGVPVLAPSVVAFIDALGTKAIASDPAAAQYQLQRIWLAIHDPLVDDLLGAPQGAYAVAAFTDNIVLGTPADGPTTDLEGEYGLLFTLAAAYQLTLACHGVFVRGGIAIGQLWMDQTFVFGSGLINAYELEMKRAVYPRVIVDGTLADMAKLHAETYYAAPARSPQNAQLVRAADGEVFINYLAATEDLDEEMAIERLAIHREQIITGLFDSHAKAGVVEKYLWAAEYHNWYSGFQFPDNAELHIDPQPNESKFFHLVEDAANDGTMG